MGAGGRAWRALGLCGPESVWMPRAQPGTETGWSAFCLGMEFVKPYLFIPPESPRVAVGNRDKATVAEECSTCPQGLWVMSKDTFDCHVWGGGLRLAAQHPPVPRVAPHPTKNSPASNANIAESLEPRSPVWALRYPGVFLWKTVVNSIFRWICSCLPGPPCEEWALSWARETCPTHSELLILGQKKLTNILRHFYSWPPSLPVALTRQETPNRFAFPGPHM